MLTQNQDTTKTMAMMGKAVCTQDKWATTKMGILHTILTVRENQANTCKTILKYRSNLEAQLFN